MHLTYVFWQTWHLMDQTWYFCISTIALQIWYPKFPGLVVVRDLSTRCGSFPQGLLFPARTLLSRATWTLWPATSWTTGARQNSGELRLRGLADREATIHRNGGDLRLRGLAATSDGNSRAEEKSRVKRANQKKIPDKNSWVHYFRKCQVKNAKHLEMKLFFLCKTFRDLVNSNKWQIPIA